MIYFTLFLTFFKIGIVTFGGGYAMLPLIQYEVMSHGWMDAASLVDFIAVSESTPGPFAINISTFVGAETAEILGALCATLGVVLPSFMVILIVAKFYERFRKSRVVSGCMRGLEPAVVGMIAAALYSVAKTVLFPVGFNTEVFSSAEFYISIGIFLLSAMLVFKKMHPIAVIVISGVLGIAVGFMLGL